MSEIKAKFIKGIKGSDDVLYDGRAQVAFIGRSNVGKSSVMNSLLGVKGLVKTSGKPGKTTELNFFLVNNHIYFVDLPGYGYAKTSLKLGDKLRKMILWYIVESGVRPKIIVQIVDANTGPSDLDREMLEILLEHGHNVIVVANKIDKLNQKEKHSRLKNLMQTYYENTLSYSAKKHTGRDELLRILTLA